MRNHALSPAGRRMPVSWTVALSLDFVLTCVSAVVLAGIGLLMPAFTEDHEDSTTLWTAGFLTGALILLGSLASGFLVLRGGEDGARRIGLLLSLLRLGLIVLTAVGYVVYGVVVVESA
ncbi:hypothetical protein ACFY3N_16550 [Streptomyces sp. NPDC000348]|uniref:hypothetical protein n=1 Tax=Streptomyces sp. NPDC000348 TaxID=3364538 RepID=UPI0036A2CD50